MRRPAVYFAAAAALAVVVFVLWRMLFPACAGAPWLGRLLPDGCPPPASAAQRTLDAERLRREALEAELLALERELAERDNCAPAPLIEPLGPRRQAEAAPAAPEGIDEERWRKKDVGVLEGCWLLDSDYSLQHRRTGKVVTVPYWRACFDAAGKGQQEFRLSDGLTCKGGVTAQFAENGRMSLSDAGDVPCDKGYQIIRRRGDCQLDGAGGASCTLEDGSGSSSQVTLRRDG